MQNLLAQKQKFGHRCFQQNILLSQFLEYGSSVLDQKIDEFLQENPALVKEELEIKTEHQVTKKQPLSSSYSNQSNQIEEQEQEDSLSFYENLYRQLELLTLSEIEKKIALEIIGSINQEGFLERTFSSIAYQINLQEDYQVSATGVECMVKRLQKEIVPSGLFCYNIRGFLVFQILTKLKEEPKKNIYLKALKFLQNSENIISSLNFGLGKMHNSEKVLQLLQNLPKKPSFITKKVNTTSVRCIKPDFVIEKEGEEIHIALLSTSSYGLKVSKKYKRTIATLSNTLDKENKQICRLMRKHVYRATLLTSALKKRKKSLLQVIYALVEFQRKFFLTGDIYTLRPLLLKQIATITNKDVATISRIVNHYHVQTPWGTFPLKFFFSTAVYTKDGKNVSIYAIKQRIIEKIKEEKLKKIYSDKELTSWLQKEGFLVTRRSVQKYRTSLHIPSIRIRTQ